MTKPQQQNVNKRRPIPRKPRTALCGARMFAVVCCSAVLVLGAGFLIPIQPRHSVARTQSPATLQELLELPGSQLSKVPIEQLNLLCATGLDTNQVGLGQCTATLRAWAEHVRSETGRHQYRYDRNPAEFENSPGFFRMLMLAVVLAEDYHLQYDPQRKAGPGESRIDDGFFADPQSVFLHGLLGPSHKGTCSSLPVLYVALGRQVGYPLKLVTTKGHLFVRWEGAGERFNVEATSHGLNRFDDDYYRHWPFEVTPEEEKAEGYLRSLTPQEEFAVFLSIRGMCLREQGRLPEAVESFAAAARLAPQCQSYAKMVTTLKNVVQRERPMNTTTYSAERL